MTDHFIVLTLLAYCFAREVFFMHTLHKLVNKVMSKNYYEYQMGEKVLREKPPEPMKAEVEDLEDFGSLQDFVN